jgi:hypothetical protein
VVQTLSSFVTFAQATGSDKAVGGVMILLALFIWTYYTMWTMVTVSELIFSRPALSTMFHVQFFEFVDERHISVTQRRARIVTRALAQNIGA